LIYIGGVNAFSPVVMQRISNDEARVNIRGYLDVSRTDSLSRFEISAAGNLQHGRISTGVTAEFLGSSFTIRNVSINYPTFQTSAAAGVILRHDNIRLQNASGANLIEAITARVSINTSYFNLRNSGGFSGGVNGDIVFSGNAVGVNINGTWRKFVMEAA